MSTPNTNKRLGTALCCLFGTAIFAGIYGLVHNYFYSLPLFLTIFFFINLIYSLSLLYAGLFKDNFNHIIGRIAAFVLVGIYSIFAFNNIAMLFEHYPLSFLGAAGTVAFEALIFASFTTFLFASKTWMPIKILGSAQSLISLISGLFFLGFNIFVMNVCTYIILMINIPALILTIIWMCRKPQFPTPPNQEAA